LWNAPAILPAGHEISSVSMADVPARPPSEEDIDALLTFGEATTRREFLKQAAASGVAVAFDSSLLSGTPALGAAVEDASIGGAEAVEVKLTINGTAPRSASILGTLLDALRERLMLTGTKKGCDHGQCGANPALRDDRPSNCLRETRYRDSIEKWAWQKLLPPRQEEPNFPPLRRD